VGGARYRLCATSLTCLLASPCRSGNNDVDYFGRTGRLFVNYNNAFKATRIDPAFSLHFSKLFGAFMLYVNDSKYPKLLPKPKRGWIAKVMEGNHDQRG
jgi:hypothetical protein